MLTTPRQQPNGNNRMNTNTKQCRTCHSTKDLSNFSNTVCPPKGSIDGKQADCKTCMTIKRKVGLDRAKTKSTSKKKKSKSVSVLPFVTSSDTIVQSIEKEIITLKKNIKSLQASKRKLSKGNITVSIKNGQVSLTI